MIEYIQGNMLTADTQALVNTVNTVGVMGKGIALQFKEQFPSNYAAYNAACKNNAIEVGKMFVFEEQQLIGDKKIIVNFPTKKDWKHKSKVEYVENGLKDLVRVIEQQKIRSIALPPLGCGNGGLDWTEVRSLMERYLAPLKNVSIVVYEPNVAVRDILMNQESHREVKLTDARAMLMYAMYYYDSVGEGVSVFTANKLAYFYQRLGASDFNRLKFGAGRYGPYSPQVAHLVHALNGTYIKGTEQMTNKAFDPIELKYNVISDISNYVRKMKEEKQSKIKDLIRLIAGFESALSLEILASVDFIRNTHCGINKNDTVKAVQDWSERKKELFKTEYISIAYDRLEEYASNVGGLYKKTSI